ncbi:ribosome hibernation-promoting factor, HPF/YfiA family [Sulfurimonas microaerophilic]|uniref:ribosome hibernation-promoting factor, HPF/YfiA family n=1 Tax=Sulfurimonas microaerophilic TaxID=3058392 RepID=UPI0027155BF4|nr:ribosome-associated translation inhibitor RaiA [Sulfurimonas sp. hsl 1-7]
MNISLTGRGLELTDTIKDHMRSSIEALKKYNMDIISANAVASSQHKKGKEHFNVEFVLNLPQKHTIVISQNDGDLHAAIDIALERAEKALRRLHDKEVDHHKTGLNEIKSENVDVKEVAAELEDEIVPVELELYKPREVEDVLNDLKESGKMFDIFIDNEDKTRVLYKRNDGKFGLY